LYNPGQVACFSTLPATDAFQEQNVLPGFFSECLVPNGIFKVAIDGGLFAPPALIAKGF